jgi:hypothetical protein
MPDVHGTCRTATKRAEALKDLLRVQAGLLRQCRTLLCRSSLARRANVCFGCTTGRFLVLICVAGARSESRLIVTSRHRRRRQA